MSASPWAWIVILAILTTLFAVDYLALARRRYTPTVKEAAGWSIFYILLALAFGLGWWLFLDADRGAEYLAGYITEKSLSADNLLIFALIMKRFQVPEKHQQKALLIGIVIALIARLMLILMGATIIDRFAWVFYLFALLLLYSACKLLIPSTRQASTHPVDPTSGRLFRWLPTTREYQNGQFTIVRHGRRLMTPMLWVVATLGLTDIVFALDSIPAIFGLTRAPLVVFAANGFALLGLIPLYFLLDDLLGRLRYLSHGLAAILIFIAIKLITETLHHNTLPFINAGQPMPSIPLIPSGLSLLIILAILAIATLFSLHRTSESRM